MTDDKLFVTIDDLMKENREMEEEIRKLRPLARLAHVITLQEGENESLHKRLVKAEWDYEECQMRLTRVRAEGRARIAELEQKLEAEMNIPSPRPGPGGKMAP